MQHRGGAYVPAPVIDEEGERAPAPRRPARTRRLDESVALAYLKLRVWVINHQLALFYIGAALVAAAFFAHAVRRLRAVKHDLPWEREAAEADAAAAAGEGGHAHG